MSRPIRRLGVVGPLLAALVACAPAASDDDGELIVAGSLAPAPPRAADATPVVIDSDLAPDDLAAIAYLVRHPAVDVQAISVPSTGMVTCGGGVDLLADFFEAIGAARVPVAQAVNLTRQLKAYQEAGCMVVGLAADGDVSLPDLDLAEPGDTRPLREILPTMIAGGVAAVSPNGVLGDPTGASPDEGALVLLAMVEDVVSAAAGSR